MKKVTCVIIAPIRNRERINKRCLNSVISQDYENFDVLVHYEKPIVYPKGDIPAVDWIIQLYKNASHNREVARKMAQITDSDYFLFLDSDIELPKNAIRSFMTQTGKRKTSIDFPLKDGTIIPAGTENPEIHIQGGWYPIYGRDDGGFGFFPSGRFIKDNTILKYLSPEPSLIIADYTGLGCCFMSREVVENVSLGDDGMHTITQDELGIERIAGDALAFGNNAFNAGYQIYMNGDVICKHHKSGRIRRMLSWKLKTYYSRLMAPVIKLWSGTKLPQTTMSV